MPIIVLKCSNIKISIVINFNFDLTGLFCYFVKYQKYKTLSADQLKIEYFTVSIIYYNFSRINIKFVFMY